MGLEVTLVAAVDQEEGAFPLCARPLPSREGTDAAELELATPVEVALELLQEAQVAPQLRAALPLH